MCSRRLSRLGGGVYLQNLLHGRRWMWFVGYTRYGSDIQQTNQKHHQLLSIIIGAGLMTCDVCVCVHNLCEFYCESISSSRQSRDQWKVKLSASEWKRVKIVGVREIMAIKRVHDWLIWRKKEIVEIVLEFNVKFVRVFVELIYRRVLLWIISTNNNKPEEYNIHRNDELLHY